MQDDAEQLETGNRERRASARQEHAQARAGTEPTNRVPAICKVLRKGIDSLYVSLPGNLSSDWAERLSLIKKEYAQSSDDAKQALACISLLDHQFTVGAAGTKLFPFVLSDDCYRIQLRSKKAEKLPLAYVQVRSTFLTQVGHVQTLSQLEQIIRAFGEVSGPATVSRIDLFVDFASPGFVPGQLNRSAWISRSREVSTYWEGEYCTGWTVGAGGLLSARLYDKTVEILKSGKDYLRQLWTEAGWDGESPVYRLEFQIRGDVLRGFGYSDAQKVFTALGSLWRYCTHEWLRLVVPNEDDKTRSRWPLNPIWMAVQLVDWAQEAHVLNRITKPKTSPALKRVGRYYFASLTSYMALKGITDALEGAERLHQEVRDLYDEDFYSVGQSFDTSARDRAARKATQWNLPFPGIQEHLESQDADKQTQRYRKASGR